jgi:molecular chaperone GrpE
VTDPTNDEVSADDPSADAGVDSVDSGLVEDIDLDETDLAELLDQIGSTGSAEELLTSALEDLERVTAERDEYLDLARRVQAEFENYKRRIDGQRIEQVQRAAEALVVEILPVLDACDAAIGHGAQDVGPIQSALLNTLEKRGLAKVDDVDVSFDPLVHEAVLTEAGDGADDEPVVTEIMRSGYAWNGRVVRPAMVKVRG